MTGRTRHARRGSGERRGGAERRRVRWAPAKELVTIVEYEVADAAAPRETAEDAGAPYGDADDEYEAALRDEEELEAGVLEEKAEMSQEAQRVVRGMKSESGVEFAPWMKIDAEAIAKAKKEREARKAKQAMQALKSDSMLIDPQAAELGAGGGLKSSVLSQEEVELRWDTADEVGNAGFIVQRRRGGAADHGRAARAAAARDRGGARLSGHGNQRNRNPSFEVRISPALSSPSSMPVPLLCARGRDCGGDRAHVARRQY